MIIRFYAQLRRAAFLLCRRYEIEEERDYRQDHHCPHDLQDIEHVRFPERVVAEAIVEHPRGRRAYLSRSRLGDRHGELEGKEGRAVEIPDDLSARRQN